MAGAAVAGAAVAAGASVVTLPAGTVVVGPAPAEVVEVVSPPEVELEVAAVVLAATPPDFEELQALRLRRHTMVNPPMSFMRLSLTRNRAPPRPIGMLLVSEVDPTR